jgi:hypothetical protein
MCNCFPKAPDLLLRMATFVRGVRA